MGGIWPQNALFCPKTLRFEGFLPKILGSNTTIGGFLLHIAHISHPCPNMMRFSAPKWVFFPPNADFFSPKRGFFSPQMLIFSPKMELFSPRMGPLCAHQPRNGALQPQNGAFVCCSAAPPSIPAPPLFAAPNSHFFTPKRSSPFPCLCVFPNEGFFVPQKSLFVPWNGILGPLFCAAGSHFHPMAQTPNRTLLFLPYFGLFCPKLQNSPKGRPEDAHIGAEEAPK